MNFRTEIEPLRGLENTIDHSSEIWTVGSCFADNIGDKLLEGGFNVEVNPLGTLYNPLSILCAVSTLVDGKRYAPADFFEHEGKWRSFDFHSIFARQTAQESADMVNDTLDRLRARLPYLTTLMLTFGSARGFRLNADGRVVANCHKQHPRIFTETVFTLAECSDAILRTIALMRGACPRLSDVILTVSPIRHKAYGLHADRVSKATLLLAVDSICVGDPAASYFPSYEIMIDDLRDYRFYAPDMVHPSPVAVDYIYEKFSDTYFTDATRARAAEHFLAFRRSLHRRQ